MCRGFESLLRYQIHNLSDPIPNSRRPGTTKTAIIAIRYYLDEAALALVVEDVFEQLAADGVIYAEIRTGLKDLGQGREQYQTDQPSSLRTSSLRG